MAYTAHTDHVGSFLRPERLLGARAAFDAGELDPADLTAVEDESILALLEMEREAGVQIFTDGEYRRRWYSGGLANVLDGLTPKEATHGGLVWRGEHPELAVEDAAQLDPFTATGELVKRGRYTDHEVAFLKKNAPGPIKVTLTTPFQYGLSWFTPGASPLYEAPIDVALAVAPAVRDEAEALVADRIDYIQLDAPGYTFGYGSPEARQFQGVVNRRSPEEVISANLEVDNAILASARAAGITTGIHLCRGNNRSNWIEGGGPYDAIADILPRFEADRLLLEYDDPERTGGFEALADVPSATIVLGLVTTKRGALEDRDELMRRIEDAARHVPLERLALGPQCGFASTAPGNDLTWDDQRRKLELIVSVAAEVWA